MGDYQEDAQLQEAVRQLLNRVGRDILDIDAYRDILKIAMAGTAPKKKGD